MRRIDEVNRGCMLSGWIGYMLVSSQAVLGMQSPTDDLPANNGIEREQRESMDGNVNEHAKGWNLRLPTLGGKQFWTDHQWWYGWRVQHNNTTDHWRLLDPSNVRHAWGGRQAMLEALDQIKANHPPIEEPDEVVLLLHGLMRTSGSMKSIASEIERSNALVECLRPDGTPMRRVPLQFSYSSTRASIADHADALRELVEHLPGKPRISAVAHSMGNIVLRHAIADWERAEDPARILPRFHRVVMLGPPNQGSSIAKHLSKLGLFEIVTGNSGVQLGKAWEQLNGDLGTPTCPFAIIAGDVSHLPVQNPLLERGPSDWIVTLEEAKLAGVEELVAVPVVHSFLISDPKIVAATVSYLSGKSLHESLGIAPMEP